MATESPSPCLRILTPEKAQATILKRVHIQESTVPDHVQRRLDEMFGARTTPLECVQKILRSVSTGGDAAVADWTRRIDNADISGGCEVSPASLLAARDRVAPALLASIRAAAGRVESFHRQQPVTSWFTNTLGGTVGQAIRPIGRVGVYAPGGTAPLPSTVLMSAVPAVVAGVREIVVVSPPARGGGAIADVTLAACAVVREMAGDASVRVFCVGGAQAVGALAYGTESIPAVDKIVGPGNIFVSIAKKEVFGVVGIDGIYGPTEAVVVADEAADARMVAADLIAQAEHDWMAVPILVTCSETLAERVQTEVEGMLADGGLARAEIARASMGKQGGIVLARSLEECIELTNEFATEHVSLAVKNPWAMLGSVTCAGGVFVGEGSCEVLGDYVAGPSHVMPTGGSARYSSPLSVVDFVKIISVVGLDSQTVREVAPHAEALARSEGLDGHALAAGLRKTYEEQ